jgi:hypothetical protein
MQFITPKPDDRLKIKTPQWGKDYVNFISGESDNSNSSEWLIRYRNYRYVNNQLYQAEFQQYCDPFGWDKGKGLDYVQPFNKLHNVVNEMQGEELRRLFDLGVVDVSPEATNERLRAEHRDYMKYIEFTLEKELKLQQAKIMKAQQEAKIAASKAQKTMSPDMIKNAQDQLNQQLEEIAKEIQKKEANIINLEEIRERYKSYQTAQEKAMAKMLKQFMLNNRIKHLKNIAFYDVVVSAMEAVRVEAINGFPEVEVLNPLGVLYHKSPEIEWIQDSDWAAYKREMTVSDVIRIYGEYLSDKDITNLKDYSRHVYGLGAKNNSPTAESPSHFHQMQAAMHGRTTYTSEVLHSGGHGYGTSDSENFLVVYDCYWKTERYVALLTRLNELNEEVAEYMDASFKPPVHAVKSTTTDDLGITKSYYEWLDEAGNPVRLYYTWIPEVWRGTKIGQDVTCRIEPMPAAFQVTPSNPYDIKLPIYGATFSNRNAPFVSIVDRMMPWYKLYLILMSKMMSLIAKDLGVITAFNTLFFSDKLSTQETLEYAVKMGMLPYNPLQNTQAAGYVSGMKAAETMQISSMANIKQYADLCQFIEQEIFKAAGIPENRLGATAPNTNVTDNRQDLQQSAYITEPLYYVHELIWEEVMQAAVVLMASVAHKDHPYVRDILSDDEWVVINKGAINKDSRFRLVLSNNGENTRIKQVTEQHLHALIQNDKAKLSTFLKLLRKGNVTADLISEIELIEKQMEDREALMQQQQQQTMQQQMEQAAQLATQKDAQEEKLKQMEIDSKERIAQMNVLAQLAGKPDADHNGVMDQLEQVLAQKASIQKDRELDLKAKEIDNKHKVEMKKASQPTKSS